MKYLLEREAVIKPIGALGAMAVVMLVESATIYLMYILR